MNSLMGEFPSVDMGKIAMKFAAFIVYGALAAIGLGYIIFSLGYALGLWMVRESMKKTSLEKIGLQGLSTSTNIQFTPLDEKAGRRCVCVYIPREDRTTQFTVNGRTYEVMCALRAWQHGAMLKSLNEGRSTPWTRVMEIRQGSHEMARKVIWRIPDGFLPIGWITWDKKNGVNFILLDINVAVPIEMQET